MKLRHMQRAENVMDMFMAAQVSGKKTSGYIGSLMPKSPAGVDELLEDLGIGL